MLFIGTWNATERRHEADRDECRVPHQEIPRAIAGVRGRFGHRDRRRIDHHQAEREQQQRGPGERRVVGEHRARARACRATTSGSLPAATPWCRRSLTHARALLLACALDQRGESLAALDVVAELVEARARRREQHGIARARDRASRAPTAASSVSTRFDTSRAYPASARASSGASRPISSTARQCAIDGGLERREVLSLAVAAGDQHDRAVDAFERGLRRRDRRALRIVDEQHAADFGDRLPSGAAGRETRRAPSSTWRSMLRDRRRERERGQRVQRVVAADERRVARRRQQQLAAAREPERRRRALDEAPFLLRQRARRRRTSARCAPGRRISRSDADRRDSGSARRRRAKMRAFAAA